jgi:uncharacterized protein YjbJ (UPF0337 family)
MNWAQIEGNWQQLKGTVKQQWGKLTDSDVDYIAGKRDRFAGKLRDRYGLSKEEAEHKADEWLSTQQGMGPGREQHSSAKG